MVKLPAYYHIHMECKPGQNKGLWIDLSPEWKALVADSDMTQERANRVLDSIGKTYMRELGFKDTCYRYSVDWGDWGIHHISVPGDACGLDICEVGGMTFSGGRRLAPHNIDTLSQICLLLQTFLWFANALILHKIVEDQKRITC